MAKVFTITEGLENMGAIRTGGQGSVYKGKRMAPVMTAVKLLPTPIYTENKDDRNFRDFQNEVDKLKKVNENPSPHVVKILNSGLTESGSLPFIEMEYIEGPDLEDLLRPPHNPVFTIREVMKLAEQLAAALAHCHRVGVKHGDIKSNNVKFNTETGNYMLLDFGLAVMSDEQRRSSLRNAGAVEFMAPEQYDGKMLLESDVYSYGVVLYEVLTGTVPFPLMKRNESSRNMVMLAHLEKQVPDLGGLRSVRIPEDWPEDKKAHEQQIPEWLLAVIDRCLEKQPERRFADGMELHEAVCSGIEASNNAERYLEVLSGYKTENELLLGELKKYRSLEKLKWVFGIMVLMLLALSIFGVNALLGDYRQGNSGTGTDSTGVQATSSGIQGTEKPAADTVKRAGSAVKRDSLKKKPGTVNLQKTKDGIVNDVPYF